MLYWTPVETPAKNPDQTSESQGSRDYTMAASLYSNQSLLDWNRTFMTVTKFMKIYEGDRFNEKKTFKGESAKRFSL